MRKVVERTRPVLTVDADAGIESVVNQQREVFEYLYDSIKMNVVYWNEPEMLENFRHKEAAVLILTHPLSEAEKENLKNRDTIYTQQVRVAYDAVAIIAGKQFDDSKLDTETLKKYLEPANKPGISLVFEQNSSVVTYILNLLHPKNQSSTSAFAVQSTEEVINYVENNTHAIGFIPYNYLSDGNDERVKKIMGKIKVLSLRSQNREGKEVRASANQSDIAEGVYPLMRVITVVTPYGNGNNDARLFVDFLFKEKGARIFLKAGLIPVQIPERIINVNTEGLKRAEQ